MVTVDANVLDDIRGRIVPMFEVAAEQYRKRVPAGYPNVIDQPARGSLGLEIDPNFALFITHEGEAVYAEIYRRIPRTDSRTGAGRQRPAGVPLAIAGYSTRQSAIRASGTSSPSSCPTSISNRA